MNDPYVKALAKRVLYLEEKLERAILALEAIRVWGNSEARHGSFVHINHEITRTVSILRGARNVDETHMPCPKND